MVSEVLSELLFKKCPELREKKYMSFEETVAQAVQTTSTKVLTLGYWYFHNALSHNI